MDEGPTTMSETRLVIGELRRKDLPFLFDLWAVPEVMRYADELPELRGWTKSEDAERAWAKYLERRRDLGAGYSQLILHIAEGMAIGESFFAPLPEGFTLDRWGKPEGLACSMGDIKLLPQHWNKGLGTEGMRLVVDWMFANTDCALLVVPPHFDNPAAVRVYEKAGFQHTEEARVWQGHRIMELRVTSLPSASGRQRQSSR
jgi:RimJ/RimL family protein N-acetyltransferase